MIWWLFFALTPCFVGLGLISFIMIRKEKHMPVKVTKILSLGVVGEGQVCTLQLREDGVMFELKIKDKAFVFAREDMRQMAAFINSEAPEIRDPRD